LGVRQGGGANSGAQVGKAALDHISNEELEAELARRRRIQP
jgi:hypothetical protein